MQPGMCTHRCWHKPGFQRRPCVVDVPVLRRCSDTTCALQNPHQLARPRSACQTQISLPNSDQLAKFRSACQTQISLPNPDQLAKFRSACQIQISLPNPDQLAKSRSACQTQSSLQTFRTKRSTSFLCLQILQQLAGHHNKKSS